MNTNARKLTTAAIVGALYAILTMVLAPISYGPIQFRLSEALCVLPFFLPSTAWGLFVGCAAANLLTGNIFDVLFGSLATLLAALCTASLGRKEPQKALRRLLACLSPVVFNGLIIGAVITRAYNGMGILDNFPVFAINCAQVTLGEAGVMLLAGLPLMHWLPEKKFFREFVAKNK